MFHKNLSSLDRRKDLTFCSGKYILSLLSLYWPLSVCVLYEVTKIMSQLLASKDVAKQIG